MSTELDSQIRELYALHMENSGSNAARMASIEARFREAAERRWQEEHRYVNIQRILTERP
jgi:hypothetical protein